MSRCTNCGDKFGGLHYPDEYCPDCWDNLRKQRDALLSACKQATKDIERYHFKTQPPQYHMLKDAIRECEEES